MNTPKLLSIQVGRPQNLGSPDATDPLNRPWYSAIIKLPVKGPVQLTETNVEGDKQADSRIHGGFDKAVLAYSADHYSAWRAELALPDFPFGAFGENLTIEGLDESNVCLGDIYSIGEAWLQVSQPRQPCYNLSRRWQIEDLMQRVKESGRTGWYLRVFRTGILEAGMPVALEERTYPEWTMDRASEIMNNRREKPEKAERLAACPVLSVAWRETLLG